MLRHASIACVGAEHVDCAAPVSSQIGSAEALYVPFGQMQLTKSLQPLSALVICGWQFVSKHAAHVGSVVARLVTHADSWAGVPVPLLLLEQATNVLASAKAAPIQDFIIADLRRERRGQRRPGVKLAFQSWRTTRRAIAFDAIGDRNFAKGDRDRRDWASAGM